MKSSRYTNRHGTGKVNVQGKWNGVRSDHGSVEVDAYLHAGGESKSFSIAGKHMGLCGPAVSRNIASLEARLLYRSTRNVSLTHAGQAFLDGCHSIMELVDRVESSVLDQVKDTGGTIKVAAHAAELGNLLRAYREQCKSVLFDVTTFSGRINVIDGA